MAQKTIYTSKEQQANLDKLRAILKARNVEPVDRFGHPTDSALVHHAIEMLIERLEAE